MTGIELIAAERQHHQRKYPASHDDGHTNGELAKAAACFAVGENIIRMRDGYSTSVFPPVDGMWPWEEDFIPKGRIKELTIAGALIAAEIDRLQRASRRPAKPSPSQPQGETNAIET
jgi:hypothetical protein